MMRSLELRREASKEEVNEGVFEKSVFGSGGVSEVFFSERGDLKWCLKVVKEEREVPWYLSGVGEKEVVSEKVEAEKEIEKEVVAVSEEEMAEKESVVNEKGVEKEEKGVEKEKKESVVKVRN